MQNRVERGQRYFKLLQQAHWPRDRQEQRSETMLQSIRKVVWMDVLKLIVRDHHSTESCNTQNDPIIIPIPKHSTLPIF